MTEQAPKDSFQTTTSKSAVNIASGFLKLKRLDFKVGLLVVIMSALMVYSIGFVSFRILARQEQASFQRRIHSLILGLSHTIDVQAIADLGKDIYDITPTHELIHDKLLSIVDQEADVDSIYILLPTQTPNILRFFIDASKANRVADTGELYDATGFPFMQKGFKEVSVEDRIFADDFGATQSGYAPLVTQDGRTIGIIGVDVYPPTLENTRRLVTQLCILSAITGLMLLLLVMFVVKSYILRPLTRLTMAAESVAAGNMDVRLEMQSRDEIEQCALRFNDMVRSLRDRERLLYAMGIYVSRDLARKLLETHPAIPINGVECIGTVLVANLPDYIQATEVITPAECISVLNQFLSTMCPIIEAHQGCVLHFFGGKLVATFGTPFYEKNHATAALECALQMKLAMGNLQDTWEHSGLSRRFKAIGVDRLNINIGLHTGSLIAGNVGCTENKKYSVLGHTVKAAVVLEKNNVAQGSTILISQIVHDRLPAHLAEQFKPMLPVVVNSNNPETIVTFGL